MLFSRRCCLKKASLGQIWCFKYKAEHRRRKSQNVSVFAMDVINICFSFGVGSPRENRQDPVLRSISENLGHVPAAAQRKAAFVSAVCENRSTEGFWESMVNSWGKRVQSWIRRVESDRFIRTDSRPVLPHKPQMVAEKWHNADEEQGRHKEEEQDVELGMCVRQLFLQRGVKTKIHQAGETEEVIVRWREGGGGVTAQQTPSLGVEIDIITV